MGQLEKYGLYVLCLVIFLILGVTIWGDSDNVVKPGQQTPSVAMHAPAGGQPDGGQPGVGQPGVGQPGVGQPGIGQPGTGTIGGGESVSTLLVPMDRPNLLDDQKRAGGNGGGSSTKGDPQDASFRKGEEAKPRPVPTPVIDPAPVATTREYTIKSGDTLSEIAQQQLGSTRFLDQIYKLNRGLKGKSLQVGKTILLPGKSGATDSSKNALARAGAYRTYTVVAGDTFESIAKKQLGSKGRINEVRKLNKSVNPRRMRIGQKIKLPLK